MADPASSSAAVLQSLVSLAITLVVMALLLFIPAGTLNWPHAWWFMGVFVVLILVSIAVLWRVNPEIFAARARPTGQGTKGWDRILLTILLLAFAAILPVAALDERFGWAPASGAWVMFGYLLLVIGFVGSAWAQAVNRHFEPSVRIQSDRDHQVISSGPYAYVRHPGYVFGSLLALGAALALGSWVAVLPALAVVVLLLVRTALEDATLQRELVGYAEYALRVRYRWVPGVW
jgi:protein-S-isoprenylcysteine O-methyltransferase Ste14